MNATPFSGNDLNPAKFAVTAVILGFTAIISQIVFLREFLLILSGNELIIGIILFFWMILTGAGAYFGRSIKTDKKTMTAGFLSLGFLPVISVFLINYLKNIVFVPGMAIGLQSMIVPVLVILLPFCTVSGFLFTLISAGYSSFTKEKQIDKVYAFESAGSILGGLLFTYFFSGTLSTFQVLSVILAVNIITVFFLNRTKPVITITGYFAAVLIAIIPFIYPVDLMVKQFLFAPQKLIFTTDTPFGNLSVTRYGDELNYYENNALLFTSDEVVSDEQSVHFAMSQHPHPENVLLVSGSPGMIGEIFKYPVSSLDYVEPNSVLLKKISGLPPFKKDYPLRLINRDPRVFLKTVNKKYDIVLINLPEPSTAQLNRFYTVEFYERVKNSLRKGGIVSFGLPLTANYISAEAIRVNSIISVTLHRCFKNVVILPGEKNFFIASDNPLHTRVTESLEKKKITNQYVNRYYMNDTIMKQRSDDIHLTINRLAGINSDFHPVTYLAQVKYWLSHFGTSLNTWIVAATILFFLFFFILFRTGISASGMFFSGYMGASYEFILILVFQVIYGYIYKTIGTFFAVFMTGLMAGSYFRKRIIGFPAEKHILIIQIWQAFILLITIPFLLWIKNMEVNPVAVHLMLFTLLFCSSFFVGLCFSVVSVIHDKKIKISAAVTYGTDLIGSAFGAFFTSVLFIPLFGIIPALLITIPAGIIPVLVLYVRGRQNR